MWLVLNARRRMKEMHTLSGPKMLDVSQGAQRPEANEGDAQVNVFISPFSTPSAQRPEANEGDARQYAYTLPSDTRRCSTPGGE